MTNALYKLGRFAARRPWVVIGVWLVTSAVVMGASGIFGAELEDTFEVPGLDSQQAVELLSAAQSDQAGLTAQVVMTPHDDDATFVAGSQADAGLTDVQAAVAGLPQVVGTSAAVSPDGRVALLTVQYPVLEEVSVADLDDLKATVEEARAASPLQVEMAATCSRSSNRGKAASAR